MEGMDSGSSDPFPVFCFLPGTGFFFRTGPFFGNTTSFLIVTALANFCFFAGTFLAAMDLINTMLESDDELSRANGMGLLRRFLAVNLIGASLMSESSEDDKGDVTIDLPLALGLASLES